METDYITEGLADLLADDIVDIVHEYENYASGPFTKGDAMGYAHADVSRYIHGLALAVEEGRLAAWLEERYEL